MMQFFWMMCAGIIAYSNGKKVFVWVVAAYFFSWIAPAVLLFLPKNFAVIERRNQFAKEITEQYATQKEFKDINTVDDLFKQLETK